MTDVAEPVEAVIISGPRRGEIVRLPETALAEVSPDYVQMLDEALDQLLAAIGRVSEEVRATTEALRERGTDNAG